PYGWGAGACKRVGAGTSTPDHQHSGPRANGYPRLAHHRPIQSVYWHCPTAPPECINRPADAFWHLCILPRRRASALPALLKLYVAAIKTPVGELTSNQVAATNGSIAEGADQTRKRNLGWEAVRDDRWTAVPISNYCRLD